jgi:hypothetical protein
MQGESDMINKLNALDRIEVAERETPSCVCGEPTVPASRTDGIWLECVSLAETDSSRIGRLLSALVATGHTRQLILDLAA